jgi:predicted ATPase
MKLKGIVLKGFRTYREETRINADSLTAFIGRNDVGKSSILEALEVFFNNELVKIESLDACVFGESREVQIGCVFSDLPDTVVLDQRARTTLAEEYLLNQEGYLEVRKIFDCSGKTPKESVYAWAVHPNDQEVRDLLQLKNEELKGRLEELGIPGDDVDRRSNPSIRRAIWRSRADLNLQPTLVPLEVQDGKKVWQALQKDLPLYALFRADRPSKDDDPEVQDPMKIAVSEAIKTVVQEKATEVARKTLDKLREMNPDLARELSPNFKAEPKWDGLFKLTLTSENQIPINKRGSGTRRLILLNFFRAEAERRQQASNAPRVIYAIEEPEASQHPANQRMIVDTLLSLSRRDDCQVLLTTHVPGLAGLLPTEGLRYVSSRGDGSAEVLQGGDELFEQVASELGVLPDNRIQVLVCVEGPNDIECLGHLSRVLNERDKVIPSLATDPRVAVFPLGGSTLRQWVEKHYLRPLRKPEVHLYDRGEANPPEYQAECDKVNSNEGCHAALTAKRELENYLHLDVIREVFEIEVAFGDADNVPEMVARALHERGNPDTPWDQVDEDKRKKKISRAKQRLNSEAADRMTFERLQERDPNHDIENWLREIARRIQ